MRLVLSGRLRRTASIELEDEPSAASAFGPAAGRTRMGKKAAGEAAATQRTEIAGSAVGPEFCGMA